MLSSAIRTGRSDYLCTLLGHDCERGKMRREEDGDESAAGERAGERAAWQVRKRGSDGDGRRGRGGR
jgi:hypothetical protein